MKLDKRKLNLARAKNCMTVRDLAKAASVSMQSISCMDRTKETKAVIVGKIAKALGVEPEDIIEE